MEPSSWIAIYAAVVATGALALEVRRWVESGPRIVVKASPNMMILDPLSKDEEKGVLVVTAYNRGEQSTTITHMLIVEYPNFIARMRNRPSKSFLIPNPQVSGPPIIPSEIKPGAQWMGVARHRPDVIPDIQTGKFWAGIVTTDRGRPYLRQIPRPRKTDIQDSNSEKL
ncbi:hypothetical protein [Xanthobacter variabilis]|uniref:hypothetical protein n=1 Tax=Xanthobacter variabilis TaxID=3119932 RepID=UPI00372B9247